MAKCRVDRTHLPAPWMDGRKQKSCRASAAEACFDDRLWAQLSCEAPKNAPFCQAKRRVVEFDLLCPILEHHTGFVDVRQALGRRFMAPGAFKFRNDVGFIQCLSKHKNVSRGLNSRGPVNGAHNRSLGEAPPASACRQYTPEPCGRGG